MRRKWTMDDLGKRTYKGSTLYFCYPAVRDGVTVKVEAECPGDAVELANAIEAAERTPKR